MSIRNHFIYKPDLFVNSDMWCYLPLYIHLPAIKHTCMYISPYVYVYIHEIIKFCTYYMFLCSCLILRFDQISKVS